MELISPSKSVHGCKMIIARIIYYFFKAFLGKYNEVYLLFSVENINLMQSKGMKNTVLI